ncbi:MAG: type II toxin-antitoxin system RelE/ParE family toxin [bacterium]
MAEVKWTEQASDDLQAITEFIAHDSPEYACLFATDILDVVGRISIFPKIGRVVPEVTNPDIREVILGNYRIVYRLRGYCVEILTVYHSSRLFDPSKLN